MTSVSLAAVGCMVVSCSDPSATASPPGHSVALQARALMIKVAPVPNLPQNPLDIVANLEGAFASRVVLNDSFYDEQNLLRLTGADRIRSFEFDSHRRSFRAEGFDRLLRRIYVGSNTYDGMSYGGGLDVAASGERIADVVILFRESHSELGFDAIQGIFGAQWKQDLSPISPGETYAPPTRLHGNDRILYTSEHEGIHRSTALKFFPDGTLYTAHFVMESR